MIPNDSIQKQIDDYWINHRFCSNVNKYIEKGSETDIYLQSQLKSFPWFNSKKKVIAFAFKKIYEPVRCKKCGKVLSLENASQGKSYCSLSCAMSSQDVQDKVKSTNQKKLGCDYPSQNKSVKQKFQKTMNERYGASYTFNSETLNDKYKSTMMDKYNCIYPIQNDILKTKIKNTNIEKYGVPFYTQTDELKNNNKKSFLEKGYDIICNKWKDYVIPLFSKDEYIGMKKQAYHTNYKWKCVKCEEQFQEQIYHSGFHDELSGGYLPRCPKCYPLNHGSIIEKEVLDFIKSVYDGEIIENDRITISPYELDIYMQEKKIAVEFDGLYWHSKYDKNYHLNKTELCNEQDIQLIHIFENEWLNKQEIVKDRIKSVLGIYDKKIYARKCKINEINSKISNRFLEQNHLQGKDNAKYRYGLYYEDELIAVMTFGKPRFNKKYDYELIRFASKIGYQVIGGASKLLDNFKKYHDGSIVSYADRRYSCGKLYEALGFEKLRCSQPNYCWYKNKQIYTRYECQKHKLSKILGNKFNPNLSEKENMELNGYNRIYDCGNIVYIIKDEK